MTTIEKGTQTHEGGRGLVIPTETYPVEELVDIVRRLAAVANADLAYESEGGGCHPTEYWCTLCDGPITQDSKATISHMDYCPAGRAKALVEGGRL